MNMSNFARSIALLLAAIAFAASVPASAVDREEGQTVAGPGKAAVNAANRAATVEPDRSAFVNAGAVYAYRENAVYSVYTAPERVTDIALEAGETLVAVASGDTVRWIIGDTTSGAGTERRVHVLLKPVSAGLATNLVITTDRRTYHLALTSSEGPAMAALSWTYPRGALLAIRRGQAADEAAAPLAAGLDVEQLNFGYLITGDAPDWRPLRAFDDGRQTYIEFPASLGVGVAPPLFLVDREGNASLVNYRVKGRFYIVDRLFGAAELRHGTKRQDVVRITRSVESEHGSSRRRRP